MLLSRIPFILTSRSRLFGAKKIYNFRTVSVYKCRFEVCAYLQRSLAVDVAPVNYYDFNKAIRHLNNK